MRIPAYSPSLYPADSARRVTQLLVDPPAPLPQHYPQQKPSARPLAERVVEGEILPRPPVAQSLLADYRSGMLTRAASRTVTTPDEAPQTAAPSQLLFYQLHSSSAALADNNLGRHIDQRV
ncbi:MAG TPA: hypothetical protein VJ396_08705 [Acidiferrobacterales bacterium]|nr:hypothetical protein [Acidiferrobacterales bacterium]